MKKYFGLLVAAFLLQVTPASAQIEDVTLSDGSVIKIDRSVFPNLDLNAKKKTVPNEYTRRQKVRERAPKEELPPYVYNNQTKYYPPVFSQDGGSCGSAQAIGYMFTYEINTARDADGSLEDNQYPSHFTWMQAYQSSSTEDIVQAVGIPNVTSYGGRTYSRLFGPQTHQDPDYGWMQGYDKWYGAMWNRVGTTFNMSHPTMTAEGRRELKEWLYNHSGDDSYCSGGVVGIGVAAYGTWGSIPTSEANKTAGVVGMSYVKAWGDVFNHALTVVGYDDRIEFDLDGDGKIGETDEDEVGAWIVCNSWGDGWENKGFIYCPYKYSCAVGTNQSSWNPGAYIIRRDYRPLRTIKLKMEYSRRSELLLRAGISQDVEATTPQRIINFEHFRNAGNAKGVSPDPEVPMLGRWADGMHYEPMEFGYDLTDLTAGFDRTRPLKYFFIVKTKKTAIGEGKILKASIMNYEIDDEGVEIPIEGENISIQNAGSETIISVIVPGEQLYAPCNLEMTDGVLSWSAPQPSSLELEGYNVYQDATLLVTLPASQTYYTPEESEGSTYSVRSVYRAGKYKQESESSNCIATTLHDLTTNTCLKIDKSGFTVPKAVDVPLNQATIEFLIKSSSLVSYNQQIGPGWGNFLFHTDSSGALYAGWNTGTNERMVLNSIFTRNRWYHVAITIDGNVMTAYVNGLRKGQVKSSTYSGLSAFGDLKFGHSSTNSYLDGFIDEFRIWNVVRTPNEIKNNMRTAIAQPALQSNLILYLPMDSIVVDGETCLHEWRYGKHATFNDADAYEFVTSAMPNVGAATSVTSDIEDSQSTHTTGIPFTLTGAATLSATAWQWEAPDARVKSLSGYEPTFIFDVAGTYPVTLTTTFATGETLTVSKDVTIVDGTAPTAAFDMLCDEVLAGDRFSFINRSEGEGCSYEWSIPGAEVETVRGTNATALYTTTGTFTVTLTATNAFGSSTASHQVTVQEAAPNPLFELSSSSILLGDTLQLIDQSRYSPQTWHWELSNGNRIFQTDDQSPYIVPKAPGIYDITLKTSNDQGAETLTKRKMLTVSKADPITCLTFTGAEYLRIPSPISGGKTLTLEFWMRPTAYDGSFTLTSDDGLLSTSCSTDGQVSLTLSGRTVKSTSKYVVLNEWHHYAITLSSGTVRFYRDGFLNNAPSNKLSTTIPGITGTITLGRETNSFNGQIDEFRIWNRTLSAAEVHSDLTNTPIADVTAAETENGLLLYYDFNQNGGDVQDRTSGAHHAQRINFGPDGDAWNASMGVFTLDTECATNGDASSAYLTNYKNPFTTTSGTVNPNNSGRFLKLLMRNARSKWQEENAVVRNGITTGAHIDTEHNRDITIETQWSGFSSTLLDYRFWQYVTLPAGKYTFYCHLAEGDPKESYVVVNEGKTLLGNDTYQENALGWAKLTNGEVSFTLDEETIVSLGILVNLEGQQSFHMDYFSLMGLPIETLETVTPTTISTPNIPKEPQLQSGEIYDLSGRQVSRPQKGVFIQNGQKVVY